MHISHHEHSDAPITKIVIEDESSGPGLIITGQAYKYIGKVYFSQKQLPRKMKSCLLIIECAGYINWQLFLWRL